MPLTPGPRHVDHGQNGNKLRNGTEGQFEVMLAGVSWFREAFRNIQGHTPCGPLGLPTQRLHPSRELHLTEPTR